MTRSRSGSASRPPPAGSADSVKKIVNEHTELDNAAAFALAVDMVKALDTVPEKVR
jgi:hypothetical protein